MTSSTKDDANPGAKPVAAATSGACEPKENPPLLWTESWRPIESAPKDGTCFLAGAAPSVVLIAHWANGVVDSCDFDGDEGYRARPDLTHWMPLPAVPGGCLEDQERHLAKDVLPHGETHPAVLNEPSAVAWALIRQMHDYNALPSVAYRDKYPKPRNHQLTDTMMEFIRRASEIVQAAALTTGSDQ